MVRYRVQITAEDGQEANKETNSLREVEERWVPLVGRYTRSGRLVTHIGVYDTHNDGALVEEWEY